MTTEDLLNPRPTASQIKAGFAIAGAVADAIREAREIPSGTLYALLLGKVDLASYQALIRLLKNAGLVEERAHLLRWTGPERKA